MSFAVQLDEARGIHVHPPAGGEAYELWKPKHGIDPFVRTEFTCGGCYSLAYALHKKTGWKMRQEMEPDDPKQVRHVWVVNDQGKAVDINGVHPTGRAPTQWSPGRPGRIVNVRPDPKETSRYYMPWAKQVVKSHPGHFGIGGGK